MKKFGFTSLVVVLLALGTISFLPPPVGATIHNLAAEFSTASNPGNGWGFYSGGNLLGYYDLSGHIDRQAYAWQIDSSQWGLPIWFKTPQGGITGLDLLPGEVATHGDYYNSPVSRVVWTSNFTGNIKVYGSVFQIRNIGRTMGYDLYVNGIFQKGDPIGVSHLRNDPISFTTAILPIQANQTVVLELPALYSESQDFVVVNLNIDTNPVPVPAAAWLLGSGLLGLLGLGYRRHS